MRQKRNLKKINGRRNCRKGSSITRTFVEHSDKTPDSLSSLNSDKTWDHCTFFLSLCNADSCSNTLSAMPPRKSIDIIRKMKPGVYLPKIVKLQRASIWKPNSNGTRYTAATRNRGCGLRFGFSNLPRLAGSLVKSSGFAIVLILLSWSSTWISRSWRRFSYAMRRLMVISRRKWLRLTCTLRTSGCDLELSKE